MTRSELEALTPDELKARKRELSQCYSTPASLFRALDREFDFQLDVAADAENAKCARWQGLGKSDLFPEGGDGYDLDALSSQVDWTNPTHTRRIFCNPPFRLTAEFAQKSFKQTQLYSNTVVVTFAPFDMTTVWYRTWGQYAAEIRVPHAHGSRVRFVPPAELELIHEIEGTKFVHSPPASPGIFIYRQNVQMWECRNIFPWDYLGADGERREERAWYSGEREERRERGETL